MTLHPVYEYAEARLIEGSQYTITTNEGTESYCGDLIRLLQHMGRFGWSCLYTVHEYVYFKREAPAEANAVPIHPPNDDKPNDPVEVLTCPSCKQPSRTVKGLDGWNDRSGLWHCSLCNQMSSCKVWLSVNHVLTNHLKLQVEHFLNAVEKNKYRGGDAYLTRETESFRAIWDAYIKST